MFLGFQVRKPAWKMAKEISKKLAVWMSSTLADISLNTTLISIKQILTCITSSYLHLLRKRLSTLLEDLPYSCHPHNLYFYVPCPHLCLHLYCHVTFRLSLKSHQHILWLSWYIIYIKPCKKRHETIFCLVSVQLHRNWMQQRHYWQYCGVFKIDCFVEIAEIQSHHSMIHP